MWIRSASGTIDVVTGPVALRPAVPTNLASVLDDGTFPSRGWAAVACPRPERWGRPAELVVEAILAKAWAAGTTGVVFDGHLSVETAASLASSVAACSTPIDVAVPAGEPAITTSGKSTTAWLDEGAICETVTVDGSDWLAHDMLVRRLLVHHTRTCPCEGHDRLRAVERAGVSIIDEVVKALHEHHIAMLVNRLRSRVVGATG